MKTRKGVISKAKRRKKHDKPRVTSDVGARSWVEKLFCMKTVARSVDNPLVLQRGRDIVRVTRPTPNFTQILP